MELHKQITFFGKPVTLIGEEIKLGDQAPNFTVIDNNLKPIQLSSFAGENLLILSVPSLDTPVCDLETKTFNKKLAKVNIKTLTISMDLPFAQKRFCDSFHIDNIILASDYKDREFGQKYGLLIKEFGLLARAIVLINKQGEIAYLQLVKEVTNEPDYDQVVAAIKSF